MKIGSSASDHLISSCTFSSPEIWKKNNNNNNNNTNNYDDDDDDHNDNKIIHHSFIIHPIFEWLLLTWKAVSLDEKKKNAP